MAGRSPSPVMVLTPTATAADTLARMIGRSVKQVTVGTVATDANDWITLPSLVSVPIGHTIKILCRAGGNFEMRTPASSNEEINAVDSDGTNEYLCTDLDTIVVTKVTNTGWIGVSYTSLGAVRTAVVPDA